MEEERLRELEAWTREDRNELTASEIVLLDAIAEACAALRGVRESNQTGMQENDRCRADLEDDCRVMEAVDLELTLGGDDAVDKARELLGERLALLAEKMDTPTGDETLPAGDWDGASDKT